MGRTTGAKTRDANLIDPNALAKNKYTPEEEKNAQFWYDLAHEEIAKRLRLPQPDTRKAKNVIMFLGDGMSLTTVAAARILQGQLKGNTGEEDALSFEKFPYTGLSRVSKAFQLSFWSVRFIFDLTLSTTDLLFQCPSAGLGMHGHSLPVRRQDQHCCLGHHG